MVSLSHQIRHSTVHRGTAVQCNDYGKFYSLKGVTAAPYRGVPHCAMPDRA